VIYERATIYDPDNADYHFFLAQIYNYSTQHLNVARAGEEYEAAVRLNPDRSSHWLELSKYYEQVGNIERSRFAMQTALERDPNWARTHWAAANLYIRLNDLNSADVELRRTAELDAAFHTQVLDLVWRFYEDPVRIMSTHIPNSKDGTLAALNYFVTQKSDDGAALAWAKLKTFETKPTERVPYVHYLVSAGKPHQALEVFLWGMRSEGSIFNASFETEPINGGFDWQLTPLDHAESRRDSNEAKSGIASWIVVFDGKANYPYYGLAHWVPVRKGRQYKLSFWMKTEGITSSEGVFVDVDGQASEKQVGTTYWQQFTIPFAATSDLVTIRLQRLISKKFDNLVKGKVWVDDFSITEVQ